MVEKKIKEMIISRYGSLRHFCAKIDVPYSTIDSILKRGIGNANVLNVIKICDALGISIDSLKNGIVEPIKTKKVSADEFVSEVKFLLTKTQGFTPQQKQYLMNTLDIINDDKEK